MAFDNIDEIRSVEWDQGYLWDIRFNETINASKHKSKLPAPFDKWFPAQTVNDTRFNLTEHPFDIHMFSGFPIPNGAGQRTISIAFYDNMKNELLEWITTWVNTDILNNGQFLSPLKECTKELQIIKLNSQREQIATFNYLVIPSGQIEFQGTEHSDSPVHTVVFQIVGEPRRVSFGSGTVQPADNRGNGDLTA